MRTSALRDDARIIAIDAAKTPSGIRRVPIAQKTADMWSELREARKIPDTRTAERRYAEFADRLSAKMKELGLPDQSAAMRNSPTASARK